MRRNRFERAKAKRDSVAKERIGMLLEMAEKQALTGDLELADRYAQLARKIGMRYQIQMPKGFNLRFCRKCLHYLVPAKNARFRTSAGKLSRQCLVCGGVYRMPLKARR
ncbi:MAG: ribonuclease P [Thermoplasmata archaeon]|nr:ribonuclease P [Thermoplasmata archaeon]